MILKLRKKQGSNMKKNIFKDNLQLSIMAIPAIILVIMFSYIPMFGVIIAFKKFNPNLGILGSKWVGIDNFKFLFRSNDFLRIMRNTVLYSMWFLFITTVANFLFAVLLYNVRRKIALKYYQTTSILPSFMSIVLVSYIVYIFLNPSTGVVNNVIEKFGGQKIDWYNNAGYWPAILTVVKVWMGVGMGSLYYYSALLSIDEELFEAARLDGIRKHQEIRYIMLPHISGLICMFLILGVGGLMNGDFGLHYQVTRNVGALYPTTDIINTYTFRALQTGSSMGRTSAVSLFSSVSGMILLVITNLIIKKIEPSKSLF
ncbi:MAG: ABC transporter permease subunit [Clostridia bacterium]|nr:ABC transporter permease subunit [Clostridia bacterium]